MKFFANAVSSAGLVAALTLGTAAQSFHAVFGSVSDITTLTDNFNKAFGRINSDNVDHLGPSVATDLQTLSNTITTEVSNVFLGASDPGPLTDREASEVVPAWQQYTQSSINLIQTLLDDHSLFVAHGLVENIIKSIRSYRASVLEYAGVLKASAESRSDEIMEDLQNLEDQFEALVQVYERT
ncbi:hypothetical protein C8Q77DRAFT_337990 [Trametes polyzona]|nr:hypothetical protein C8Q77DRAFT_337990 [Trametes polyzona]